MWDKDALAGRSHLSRSQADTLAQVNGLLMAETPGRVKAPGAEDRQEWEEAEAVVIAYPELQVGGFATV